MPLLEVNPFVCSTFWKNVIPKNYESSDSLKRSWS